MLNFLLTFFMLEHSASFIIKLQHAKERTLYLITYTWEYSVKWAYTTTRLRLYIVLYCLKTDVGNIMENKLPVDIFCTQIHVREWKICLDSMPLRQYYSNTTIYRGQDEKQKWQNVYCRMWKKTYCLQTFEYAELSSENFQIFHATNAFIKLESRSNRVLLLCPAVHTINSLFWEYWIFVKEDRMYSRL